MNNSLGKKLYFQKIFQKYLLVFSKHTLKDFYAKNKIQNKNNFLTLFLK